MERLTSEGGVPAHLRGAIIALGNFDGFHLGHQAVVGHAIRKARAEGRPAIVATFDPHPVRLFVPDAAPFRLTTLDQRERLFAAAGADAMLVFQFTRELAAHTAAQFVAMLAQDFGAAGVVTGEDFTFGKGRAGNVERLRTLGHEMGLSAHAVSPVVDETGEVISSSRIRDALVAGDCATAMRLLSRPFAIEGMVIDGDKRGRTIGFPTANMELGPYLRPAYGIYAVQVRLPDGSMKGGAASLGIRPMFDPPNELLETYLLDFTGDLYGQTLEIALIERLRGEEKFDGLDALVTQMNDDIARVRQILG
ncbi:MAG TPA: bifunctional riboflavin kinase/FAD synthetase [Sphingobium sp.]